MDLIVWDLHGVMEVGNELSVMEFSNRVLEGGVTDKRFTLKDIHELYGLPWYQYFQQLVPSLPEHVCLQLQAEAVALGHANFDLVRKNMNPTEGLHKTLIAIENAGHEQIVISNTDNLGLPKFLDILGIRHLFPEERAFATEGSSKPLELLSYLEGKRFDNIVIIDDSQGGVDLARGVDGVSVLYVHPEFSPRVKGEDYFTDSFKGLRDIVLSNERMRLISSKRIWYTAEDFEVGQRVRLFHRYSNEVEITEGVVLNPNSQRELRKGVQLRVEKKGRMDRVSPRIIEVSHIHGRPGKPYQAPTKYPYTSTFIYSAIEKAARLN